MVSDNRKSRGNSESEEGGIRMCNTLYCVSARVGCECHPDQGIGVVVKELENPSAGRCTPREEDKDRHPYANEHG